MRVAAGFALRTLARVAFAIWFGGFTFYAGVVVPDLHDTFGGPETGEISRRVAVTLYGIGLTALISCWLVAAIDRAWRSGWRGWARLGLLASSSLLLVAQVAMHRIMGARLDSGESHRAFLPLHESYLIVGTVQWLANLGLLALDTVPNFRKTAE